MEHSKKYRKILASWETPFSKTTEAAWNELEPKLTHDSVVVKGFFDNKRSKTALLAAASVALLLAVMFWPSTTMREVASISQETIVLPDNSTMILNAHSKAKFAESWSVERKVELDGQAFFQVNKGEKFTVVTANGEVEVLGTSFDVSSREKSFRILCHTGKVKVTALSNSLVLLPGQSAEVKNDMLVQGSFDVEQSDWRKGEFSFKEEQLSNVFEEIERQFNVEIKANGIEDRFFTGRFTNKNLNEALETVCLPMGLKFKVEGNLVLISSK